MSKVSEARRVDKVFFNLEELEKDYKHALAPAIDKIVGQYGKGRWINGETRGEKDQDSVIGSPVTSPTNNGRDAQDILNEYLSDYDPSTSVSCWKDIDALEVAIQKLQPNLDLPPKVSWKNGGKQEERDVKPFLWQVSQMKQGLMDIPPGFPSVVSNFARACNKACMKKR